MTTAEDVERAVRVRGPATVTLRWTCGRVVSQPSRFAQVFAFGLCRTSVVLAHARDAYDAGVCTARCPSCGATLTQRKDGPEVAT